MQKIKLKTDSRAGEFLKNYLIDLSASRMGKHCPQYTFEAREGQSYDTNHLAAEETSMIMMWSQAATIILKIHYNIDVARQIAATALAQTLHITTDEMVRAYMNEFNNLQGGFFRGVLEDEKYLIGMSLPFNARGSDESLYFTIRNQDFIYTEWKLKSSENHEFSCSSEILINESCGFLKAESSLTSALEKDKVTDGGGDIEFF
jgi:hypothetical protein